MNRIEEAIRYYARNPVDFVEDIIRAKPDSNQKAILRSVEAEPMTSVRSGHGVGKSAVESWVIIWFLCTRPYPKVPCTAPTQHQMFDILWAETAKWIRNNPVIGKELIWTNQKIYMRGHPEEWFAAARTATNPDALQGFHAEHLLFIIDEASGVKDIVFEPVLGALSTEGAKLLMCGNPTRLTGFFYDSHHKNRASYNTLHIDGRTSERVNQEFVDKITNMFGADSDVFRVRVAGDFPKAQADSFIAMEWAEKAAKKEVESPGRRLDIGVDVARYGDDDSVIYPVFDQRRSDVPVIFHHNDTMELAGSVIVTLKSYAAKHLEITEFRVKVDCDGLGVGVYDRLNEQQYDILEKLQAIREEAFSQIGNASGIKKITLKLVECHFGGAGGALDEGDPIEFENNTGIMWGRVRKLLKAEMLSIWNSEELISQLSNRKYTVNSKGKIELEKKETMKKRGVSSPDIADALALACYEGEEAFSIDGLL